jgi:hypothetical protein
MHYPLFIHVWGAFGGKRGLENYFCEVFGGGRDQSRRVGPSGGGPWDRARNGAALPLMAATQAARQRGGIGQTQTCQTVIRAARR